MAAFILDTILGTRGVAQNLQGNRTIVSEFISNEGANAFEVGSPQWKKFYADQIPNARCCKQNHLDSEDLFSLCMNYRNTVSKDDFAILKKEAKWMTNVLWETQVSNNSSSKLIADQNQEMTDGEM